MNAIATTEIDTTSLPAIGVELNIDSTGAPHIWRAVLAFPNEYTASTEHLMRMPHPGPYLLSPIHPLAGDMTEYLGTPEEQADAIADALKERGYDTVVGTEVLAQNHFAELLEARGISVKGIEIDIPSDLHPDDPFGIGGGAGHEIAHLADFRASNERRRAESGCWLSSSIGRPSANLASPPSGGAGFRLKDTDVVPRPPTGGHAASSRVPLRSHRRKSLRLVNDPP